MPGVQEGAGGVTAIWQILTGDCLDVLRLLPDASVDAVVTDPPAGISFMGKAWDGDKGGRDQWVAWLALRMREALRVLKPGGHALVWALPRTSHWTAMALEDAGFEIRDRISHLFGSGFPKSLDVSKEIDRRAGAVRDVTGPNPTFRKMQTEPSAYNLKRNEHLTAPATAAAAAALQGWGTALKPACEDWWLARKPLSGTVAACVLEHGTGALNIDGCRVSRDSDDRRVVDRRSGAGRAHTFGTVGNRDVGARFESDDRGRWPSHLVLSHGPRCLPDACADGCPAMLLDEQSGVTQSHGGGSRLVPVGYGGGPAREPTPIANGDEGGASRYFTQFPFDDSALEYEPFFYTAKASTDERESGCEHLPARNLTGRKVDSAGTDSPRAGAGRKGTRKNAHPTVKSVDLMRWLCRLVTPPGGLVLDLFAGSGSTGVACSAERLRFIGIELDPEYAAIARARIEGDAPLFNTARAAP